MVGKKSRSPNLKPFVKKLIFSRAINQRNIPRDFLARALIKEIKEAGEISPSLETAIRYISDARNKYKPLDEPWTTDVCSEYASDFPPESIPYLLQLWRYSIHLDEVFTIRHAIWAARLAFQLKDMDVAEIWLRSCQYAHEEKISLLAKTSMRTFQLDASLVMDDWERETVDVNNGLPYEDIHHTPINRARDDGIMEEYINVLSDYGPSESLEQYNKLKRLYYLIVELPSPCKYFNDIETRLIYLSHLTYISKIPKWKTLSPEEIREIIVDLRKWVLDVKTNPEKFENPCKTSAPHIVDVNQDPTLVPTHIYERLEWSREGED